MPPPESLPVDGDIVDGVYRVGRELGRGAMGIVFLARHTRLEHEVALKVLRPLPEGVSERAVDRFWAEAKLTAQLKNDHVCQTFGAGEWRPGIPYIAMEYLSGRSLEEVIGAGPVDWRTAVPWILQAIVGLAAAHAAGVVHRDLKPSNLFLASRPDDDPIVKVLDFGISKVPASVIGKGSITREHDTVGSPPYMSPEQFSNAKDVDARCDIWALSVVLYEALTGAPPFAGEWPAIVAHVLRDPPPPLHTSGAPVPEGLTRAILAGLKKDRNRPPPDVAAFAELLAPFGGDEAPRYVARTRRLLGGRPAASVVEAGEFESTLRTSSPRTPGPTTELLAPTLVDEEPKTVRIDARDVPSIGTTFSMKAYASVGALALLAALLLAVMTRPRAPPLPEVPNPGAVSPPSTQERSTEVPSVVPPDLPAEELLAVDADIVPANVPATRVASKVDSKPATADTDAAPAPPATRGEAPDWAFVALTDPRRAKEALLGRMLAGGTLTPREQRSLIGICQPLGPLPDGPCYRAAKRASVGTKFDHLR